MQFLYVLVSTPKDIYYEQFLLSVTSLRRIMPNAEVVLLCDSKTNESLCDNRAEYKKLVSKTIIADVPGTMPQVEVSRWVKTSMRRLVAGDFLFIDCDTIITDDLSSVAELGIQFGACLDKHALLNKHGRREGIIKRDKKLGFTSYTSNRHYNSGIIFCADNADTHKVFDRWHELWQLSNSKNVVRDQPSFNMAIHENTSIFTELDGIWNCQIAFSGLPFLANSKIIHYFASDLTMNKSPFLLASDEIFKKIKETGTVPDEALEMLKNPRTAFDPETRILAGDSMLFLLNSPLFELIQWIKEKTPGFFRFLNWCASILKKIAKFFIVRKGKKNDGGIKHYN